METISMLSWGCAPTLFSGYGIVVEYAQCAEMDALGIVVVSKTERMVAVEPTVVGMTSCAGSVDYFFHNIMD